MLQAVLDRQEWLTNLAFVIGTTDKAQADDDNYDVPQADRFEESWEPKDQFPALPWKAVVGNFTWRIRPSWPSWKSSETNWQTLGSFLTNRHLTVIVTILSYAELAVLFVSGGI
ncbi:unnamed protein product [Durusdinium trenchii]|uniref:Uncharacterized protein n=1 Tax=Durusdinium trenchii TaxID=1381693 RepID=A0ABP0MDZ2_9DINO